MKNYVNRYMAVCVPGMEFIAADEIQEIFLNTNNLYKKRGKVMFDCSLADMDYNNLKCIDNLYKLFKSFNVGFHKADLQKIGKNISNIDFEINGVPKIIVSASRSGRHTYSRFDIANQVQNSLVSTGKFSTGDNINHDLAIRIDVEQSNCTVYKQITSAQMRFRGNDFNTAKGGIRPSVAHCLVRLSQPKKDDVFYDPFCGAGTIPFERSYYKSKKIYASDCNDDVLETAKTNLDKSVIVFSADATKSKMKDSSVNKIVTNMPWGKQIKVDDIYKLYYDFANELKRILTCNGSAVILTDQISTIETVCCNLKLTCSRIAELSLHGLNPIVFMITRQ